MNKFTFTLIITIISLMATSCGNTVAPTDNIVKAKAKLQPAFYGTLSDTWIADKMQPLVVKYIDPIIEPGDLIEIANRKYIVVTIDRPYDDYTNEHLRAYQVELLDDSVKLYDGNRLVYGYRTNWKHGMDSAILKDNE